MSEVQTVIEDWAQAIVAQDISRVVAHFVPDVTQFDLGVPLRRVGSEKVRERMQAWLEGYAEGEGPGFDLRDLEIAASGDVAYATCLCHVTGRLKTGAEVDMWVRNTLGLRKIEGRWKIAHQHMSSPIDFTTMKAVLDAQP